MSDTKQTTAVEWLIEQITSKPISEFSDEDIFGIFGNAKAMEREQMRKTWDESRAHVFFDDYYSITYGK